MTLDRLVGAAVPGTDEARPQPDVWTTVPQALLLAVRGRTARTAGPIALVVGTLLSVVNQGAIVVAGDAGTATWVRVGVNYCVPFVVASLGWLSGRRVRAAD